MTIEKLWRDVLVSADIPKPIVSLDELDEVISLMIHSRVDMQVFIGNLFALFSQGIPSINPFNEETPMPTSQSIIHFVNLLKRPINVPMWMLAAFPDVIDWITQSQRALEKEAGSQDTTDDILRLYGIEPELEEAATEEVVLNQQGQIKVKYYRHLLDCMKKRLVGKGAMYSGQTD